MNLLYILSLLNFILTLIIDEANSSTNYKLRKVIYNENGMTKLFSGFIRKFNKLYCNKTEHNRRFKIFAENVKYINRKNEKNDDLQLGITTFADMTSRELKKCSCLADISKLPACDNKTSMTNSKFTGHTPAKWDWRDYNAVGPVRHQGACGSCWAFSSVGALSSMHAIKYGDLYSLSAQQLLDCTDRGGCGGGYPHLAIRQLAEKYDGIAVENDYPYKRKKGICQAAKKKKVVRALKVHRYKLTDENKLKSLVYHRGPIIVGMQTGKEFNYVQHGIGRATTFGCVAKDKLSHAVLIVGYGEDYSGKPFWIMKNSFGTFWGEKGYFRMLRGQNVCKILSYVVEAEVV